MTHFNKPFAAFAALALAFSLAACNNSPTAQLSPYERYIKAADGLASASSYSASVQADMRLSAGGASFDLGYSGDIKQVTRDLTDIDMEMRLSLDFMGMSIDTLAYYKDGFYYTEVLGERQRIEMPVDQALSQSNAHPVSFNEDAVLEATATDTDEGTELFFQLDGAALDSVVHNALGGAMGELFGDLSSGDLTITVGDMTIWALVGRDDALKGITVSFVCDMHMFDESMSVSMSMTIDSIKTGGITVEFPDDLDTYGGGGL